MVVRKRKVYAFTGEHLALLVEIEDCGLDVLQTDCEIVIAALAV